MGWAKIQQIVLSERLSSRLWIDSLAPIQYGCPAISDAIEVGHHPLEDRGPERFVFFERLPAAVPVPKQVSRLEQQTRFIPIWRDRLKRLSLD